VNNKAVRQSAGKHFYARARGAGHGCGNRCWCTAPTSPCKPSIDSSNDDGWAFCGSAALGILAVIKGYRSFRFGEEVEHLDREARKAVRKDQGFSWTSLLESGINLNQEVKKWLE
jgi:hypothetical protein